MIKSIKVTSFKYIRNSATIKNAAPFIIISGNNRQGKTSFIEAIRWAIVGGPNSALINHKEDEMRVLLSMDKGTTIERSLLRDAKKNRVNVVKGDGTISDDPEGLIKTFFNINCFNPIKFCEMKPKEQAEIVRTALASRMTISKEEAESMGFEMDPVLRVDEQLENAYNIYYQKRTLLNKQIDSFEKTQKNIEFDHVPTEEEMAEIQTDIDSINKQLDAAIENNAKATVAASNKVTVEKLLIQLAEINKEIKKLKGGDPVTKKDIDALQSQYDAKNQEESDLRATVKQLEKTLGELGDSKFPVCPISKRIACSTDISTVKADIGKDLKKAVKQLTEMNDVNSELKVDLDNLRKTFEDQKNLKIKLTEQERIKSTIDTIKVSDCEIIDTSEMKEHLSVSRDTFSAMKVAKEFAGATNIKDIREEQVKCDKFVKEIRNFQEKVLPQRIKLDVPDTKLKSDGIYFRDTLLSEECTSVQLRIAVAIMKCLYPKNNLMTIDRLESLDADTLHKFVKQFVEDGKIQVIATFVGTLPKKIAEMEDVAVVEMVNGELE